MILLEGTQVVCHLGRYIPTCRYLLYNLERSHLHFFISLRVNFKRILLMLWQYPLVFIPLALYPSVYTTPEKGRKTSNQELKVAGKLKVPWIREHRIGKASSKETRQPHRCRLVNYQPRMVYLPQTPTFYHDPRYDLPSRELLNVASMDIDKAFRDLSVLASMACLWSGPSFTGRFGICSLLLFSRIGPPC